MPPISNPPTRASRTQARASLRQSRPRPCKRGRTANDDNSALKVYQETVFAIPELLDLITAYFDKRDLRVLIRVCRAWNTFWVPYLYSQLFFYKYKRSRVYPKLGTYGVHVKALDLHSTKWNNIIHLLDYTPNLSSLDIYRAAFSLVQFEEVLSTVPQLRSLRLTFHEPSCEPHGWSLAVASALPSLEEFSWKGDGTLFRGSNSKIRIDDILHILKSCPKLRSLRLAHLSIMEEFCPTEPQDDSMQQDLQALVKVEDAGWLSRSLRLLECDYVFLGPRQSTEQVHPCIHRLFQHAPELRTIKFTGVCNLGPSDWAAVFKRGGSVEHVELKPFGATQRGRPEFITVKDALVALATSTSNLKILNTKHAQETTDQHFAPILRANRHLQRLCVRRTGFGDASLRELVHIPSNLSIAVGALSQHRIVELDMEGCLQVTTAGVLLVLENCRFLQNLNLASTTVGTLELFNGSKPWACEKSLEILEIDIQPIGFRSPLSYSAWPTDDPPHAAYSPAEQQIIHDRLCSLISLTQLELKGENMEHGIFNNASSAPRLRKAVISLPFMAEEGVSPSFRDRQARVRAMEIGREMFPGWLLTTSMGYHDRRDFLALIQVCRTWNALWVPYLYSKLSLNRYNASRAYPRMEAYGGHVKALSIQETKWNSIIHVLACTPNLSSLDIQYSPISSTQLQEILITVPRLRTFNVLFAEPRLNSRDCPLILASMLPDLEELSWKGYDAEHYGGYSKVCVEDILLVLKSCTKLRSLQLANILNTEELEPASVSEDTEWLSSSLRLFECHNVQLGLPSARQDAAKQSWIRRLLQHVPNLRTFRFTGVSNLPTLDWTAAFRNVASLEHVELWSDDKHTALEDERFSGTTDAIAALSASCSNLKVLNTQYAYPTTDPLFEPIMRANRHLQRICVKRTEFGDRSLKELFRTFSVLSAMCTPADNLVQLDVEGCHQVTSAGVLPILENCRFLKDLNLAGTSAGTLELFNGSRPWACVKSLETVRIDIQPVGFQLPSSQLARRWDERLPTSSTVLYSLQEQLIIKERLRRLSSLTILELRGGAMDLAILDETSFAPHLRMINITVPCREQRDPSPTSQFSLMNKRVQEVGSMILPTTAVSTAGLLNGGGKAAWKISAMMVPVSDTEAPKPDQHFVDAIPEGTVVCISQPRNMVNAVWGGLMTARAQIKGALGVIVDGRIRDLNEQREAGFPVFAKATSIMGAGPFTRASALNVPITMQPNPDHPAVTIHAGDYIVADADGIVVIPKDLLAQVEAHCKKSTAVDDQCMEALKAGESIVTTFKKYRG
ncbi:hypothetical protein BGZ72_003555 [Mortierella alpina]|nr:hypothetical protein BGZ72_003555 [Mortierella alpina]